MANKAHVDALAEDPSLFESMRSDDHGLIPELSYADLSSMDLGRWGGLNLSHGDFSFATLKQTVLRGTDVSHASFYRADLTGANLRGAIVYNTNFEEANLSGADFTDATIYRADFTGANLTGTILAKAHVLGVNFQSTHGRPVAGRRIILYIRAQRAIYRAFRSILS